MNGALAIGATGLGAQERALEILAHNIANINTAGFKRTGIRFSEVAVERRDNADLPLSTEARSATHGGVALQETPRSWRQGDLRLAGDPMSVAIQGDGFIELMGANGRALLWRGGALTVNPEGYLAAEDGTALRAMITVPPGTTAIAIGRDGVVSAIVPEESGPSEIGRLDIVLARDPDMLTEVGSGYYEIADVAETHAETAGVDGAGIFVQGSIEQANVALSDEMVGLLMVQRAYAASAQLVQAGDQLMSIANNLRR